MFGFVKNPIEAYLWQPRFATAKRPVKIAIRVGRFLYALLRDFLDGQLVMRAMGLAFLTIVATVPLLALSFSVLKGYGVHQQIEPLLANVLAPFGEKGTEVTANVIGFVDNIRVEVLGFLGLAFLLYTVTSLVQKIESSFNYVWYVDRARNFARRITEYFSVILLGPVIMFIATAMVAAIGEHWITLQLAGVQPLGDVIVWLGKLTPFVLIIFAFSFIYGFVPNTKVRLSAALVGGVVGGILWVGSGFLFRSIVVGSANYPAIYTSFAVPLLILIWLYMSWIIVLLGAQIAFYFQNPRFLRTGRKPVELSNAARERLALNIMYLVGRDFQQTHGSDLRTRWTLDNLSRRLGLPQNAVESVANPLMQEGLLLETDNGEMIPGRDTDSITLAGIVAAVRRERRDDQSRAVSADPPVAALIDSIESAIDTSLGRKTLKNLVAPDASD